MRAVVRCTGGIPMQRYVIILKYQNKNQNICGKSVKNYWNHFCLCKLAWIFPSRGNFHGLTMKKYFSGMAVPSSLLCVKNFLSPHCCFLHFCIFVFLCFCVFVKASVCVPIIYIKLLNVFNNLIRYTPSGLCFLRLQKCKNAKTQRLALLGCALSVAGFPFISYSAIYVCFP